MIAVHYELVQLSLVPARLTADPFRVLEAGLRTVETLTRPTRSVKTVKQLTTPRSSNSQSQKDQSETDAKMLEETRRMKRQTKKVQ